MNADAALADVLNLTLRDRHDPKNRFVVVLSPPGAGKTTLVQAVAATACEVGLRVALVCSGTKQVEDLARRFRATYRSQSVRIQAAADRSIPADLQSSAPLAAAEPGTAANHHGHRVEVMAAAKVPYLGKVRYDLIIVDEAFQITMGDFLPCLAYADRFLLVGDPGQLPPVVKIDQKQFIAARCRVNDLAPRELLRDEPQSPVVRLGETLRLPQDAVDIIGSAFYPDLPFQSAANATSRRLRLQRPGRHDDAVDHALDLLADGAAMAMIELSSSRRPGPVDLEATWLITEVVARAFERGLGPPGSPPFQSRDFAIIDPHVASGAEIRRQLQDRGIPLSGLLLDTPERSQGLERAFSVLHLSSGETAFDLDPGRACVAMTRMRFGCIVVTRGQTEGADVPESRVVPRPLGEPDRVWKGSRALQQVREALASRGRIVVH